ncbi:MAG: PQQ-binding-like beta-propeller repeat protein [Candidatus Hadarchaeales archaeon]
MCGLCQAEEWPTFRRDSLQTGYSQDAGPERPDIAWSAEIEHCTVHLTVSEYIAYVVSGEYVYAINVFNGSRIWTVKMDGNVSPVTVYGGDIYFGTAKGTIHCLKGKTGSLNWSSSVSGGVYDAPLIANGRIYLIAGTNVYSIYPSTGQKIWERSLEDTVTGLSADSNSAVVVTESGCVWNFDPNGGILWKVATGEEIIHAPSISDGLIYVSAGNRLIVIDNGAVAENLEFGSKVGPVSVGPDTAYFGCENGSVVAITKNTFEERWNYVTGGKILSPPAIGKNRMYVVSGDGCLYCISAENGGLIWKSRLGLKENSYPVIAYLKIFVFSGNSVYCIGSWGSVPNGALTNGLIYLIISMCFFASIFALRKLSPEEKPDKKRKAVRKHVRKKRSGKKHSR